VPIASNFTGSSGGSTWSVLREDEDGLFLPVVRVVSKRDPTARLRPHVVQTVFPDADRSSDSE